MSSMSVRRSNCSRASAEASPCGAIGGFGHGIEEHDDLHQHLQRRLAEARLRGSEHSPRRGQDGWRQLRLRFGQQVGGGLLEL
jgi:hypothetical protein